MTQRCQNKSHLALSCCLCAFSLRSIKDGKILVQRKGIIRAVMMTDREAEQDLKQITRAYCSGSDSDVFAETLGSRSNPVHRLLLAFFRSRKRFNDTLNTLNVGLCLCRITLILTRVNVITLSLVIMG